MVTDSSPEELHEFARCLGLRRGQFQRHERLPHYDLRPRTREQALALGAAAAFEVVRHANAMVAERQPWAVARDPGRADELDLTLAAAVRYLAAAAVMLSPFMPAKSAELWERLGSGGSMPGMDELATLDVSGWTVQSGGILFPRPEVAAPA